MYHGFFRPGIVQRNRPTMGIHKRLVHAAANHFRAKGFARLVGIANNYIHHTALGMIQQSILNVLIKHRSRIFIRSQAIGHMNKHSQHTFTAHRTPAFALSNRVCNA